ncbi:UPF0547 protein C16orf87 homolog [Chrysoperla carnea]|uniref:UPF0547 protein C16orf87 homolog n=1 Tax=Chrysoperla carnea TaxID=189513 RepID=UPI001D073110|nr:UPF0547 protein C16orf87 homolog [Chrysoperla carnea]
MPKKQMISKGCPKCEQQVPVACKACRCGHSFFKAKKGSNTPAQSTDTRRRTSRVRREKPNYYDSLEFEKQVKKTRTSSRVSECDDDDAVLIKPKPKKRKVKKEEEEEEEPIQNLSGDKQLQCMIILAELNRKMGVVTWKPLDE